MINSKALRSVLALTLSLMLTHVNAQTAPTDAEPPEKTDASLQELLEKEKIREVVSNWAFWRDAQDWPNLLSTFHPEGTILISWFDGSHEGFVNESKKTAGTKHDLGNSRVEVNGSRAIAESNVTIMVRAEIIGMEADVTSRARFVDFFERREGHWKIVRRVGVYEHDRLDLVSPSFWGNLIIGFMSTDEQPPACRYLCTGLARKGYVISPGMVSAHTEEEKALRVEATNWLRN